MTTIFDLAVGRTIAQLMIYTQERYKTEIYQAARLYWKEGVAGNFVTRMNVTIKFGLNAAFEQGASVVGVEPDEFSPEDKDFIAGIIAEEKSHVNDLLDFIDGLARSGQNNLEDANYRLDMWVNRYTDVIDQAKIRFGKKTRLMWTLGPTEHHCNSTDKGHPGVGCADLAGIVAWAEEWEQAGIKPKSQKLKCSGFQCECQVLPTTKRRSPRALDRIMDAITAANI